MFKKVTGQKKQEQTTAPEHKTPSPLPLVISLEHPFQFGERTVSEIVCERRPTIRTMKRLAAAGDDDAEIISIMFEEMFDLSPRESDMVDMEDGINALERVTDFFPKLKADQN